jgi:type VI secretion system protein ImpH
MAATRRGPDPVVDRLGAPNSVAHRLIDEGYAFDFFQAVRLLCRLWPERSSVGLAVPPRTEVVRFRAHLSLSFPASTLYEVLLPDRTGEGPDLPVMTVTFMGLTGPKGVLPQHYTDLLLRLDREAKGGEKHALRAWFDLFNHRMIALFYRAWEKYRFPLAYERVAGTDTVALLRAGKEGDPFHQMLFSLVGLGMPSLRNRLQVTAPVIEVPGPSPLDREQVLARIEDLALLHYSGLIAQRPRSAVALQALLHDYFGLPVEVRQFQGQWLRLDETNRSRLERTPGNNGLGLNLVAGERVWDVQGKVRLRLGPMRLAEFNEFLPERTPIAERKSFFLLVQLARLYLGPELDFDVQLVLSARDVPTCRLASGQGGSRLGWNSWVRSQPAQRDADDAVFEGEEVYHLAERETAPG